MMKAVGNTVANAPGVIIPMLGVWLRARFGMTMPQYDSPLSSVGIAQY